MNASDSLFAAVSDRVLHWVEEDLAEITDEFASDAELEELFIRYGLTVEQAKRAIEYRPKYSGRVYLWGQTPIRVGDKAVSLGSYSDLNQYL